MLPNKAEYGGIKQVFSFSLQQYFKQKATFVMLLIMLLCSVGSVFIMSASMKRGQNANRDGETLYILNESPYALDPAELPDYLIPEPVEGSGEAWLSRLNGEKKNVLLWIDPDPEGGWRIRACTGEGSKVSGTESARIASYGRNAFRSAKLAASGADGEQQAAALARYSAEAVTQKDFLAPPEDNGGEPFDQGRFLIGFVYAIVAFMLVSMSVSYVVRAVAEEKSSKLIDQLMVSVRPLALIWGKILAAMCVVLAGILMIALGMAVTRTLLGVEPLPGGVSIGAVLAGLGAKELLCILLSLLLGYLCFSLLGGIAGSCSSGEEGTDTAATAATLLSLAGYMIGIFTSFSGNRALQTVVSLLPLISAFTAPARYISGDISFWVLLLSWVLQAGTGLLLGRFCAAVYGALLIHRGEKIKLKQLLRIFREQKGVRA